MSNILKTLITVSAVFGLMVASTALCHAQNGEERQFDAISRLIEKADLELEAGKSQEATQLYGATIAAYRDFSARFPEYRTELIQFRMAYCRNQLMGLLAAKQATKADASAATPVDEKTQAIEKAIGFCRAGHFADAETLLQELLANHPTFAPALLAMATAALGKGNLGESKLLLEHCIELDPLSAAAHYNLAQLIMHDTTPDFEKAKEHYIRARELGAVTDQDLESVLDL